MDINTGNIIDGIINVDLTALTTDRTTSVTALLIVAAVISVLMCFMGLKLIRIWNILIGLMAGGFAGLLISGVIGLTDMTAGAVIIAAAVLLAVLGGIFKKFGVFIYCLVSIFTLAAGIIQPKDWVFVAVCGGIGLIAAITAMLAFEPLIIIVTAVSGGSWIGIAALSLAGISNIYITLAIAAVAVLIGLSVQFALRSREIAKKEVRHAEAIKDEISKAQEVEHLRALLDDEEE